MLKNKKGIATIFVFIIVILVLIGIYLMLLVPLPAFTKIRTIINYFLILILWFVFQGLIVFGYFRLGKLAVRGFFIYKKGIIRITERTKNLFDVGR